MLFRNIPASFIKGCSLVTIMWLFRWWYTQDSFYGFLLWNLFLALVPYVVSQHMYHWKPNLQAAGTTRLQAVKWWTGFALWLLFFPNAPYIVTDLIHLTERTNIHTWYDAAMIFCAASTGLWIGCLSLMQIEALWREKVPLIHPALFTGLILLLCGYGIYLGRFGRFNSWDVVTNPLVLARTVAGHLFLPWQHPRTWSMTFLFAGVFWVGYGQVKQLIRTR